MRHEEKSDPLSRATIADNYFADEDALVGRLIDMARFSPDEANAIALMARRLVNAARSGRRRFGHIDALMNEYSLSNEEGVQLMCLAEALLRIPDQATADGLIADKIAGGQWRRHLGRSDSLFVNASTWGLMLTGRIITLKDRVGVDDPFDWLKQLTQRSGEPVIRQAMRQAMRILGKQFVLGRTIDEALQAGGSSRKPKLRFSYDMLGEAAMTAADAERYYGRYVEALDKVGAAAGPADPAGDIMQRPGLSLKLSALHPRFEPSQRDRVMRELAPRVLALAEKAKAAALPLTVDAEEMDRLDMTLELFAHVLLDPKLAGYDGLGIAVQAYARRAMPVLEWLHALAGKAGRRIPVRLVKGAYWDSEIKNAQIDGHDSYPVFTRKSGSDVSFLAAARYLIGRRDRFYLQFATHNAHSIAAIATLAGTPEGLEFQRLHGMGEAIYDELERAGGDWPVRVYAPVGGHEELLAYLVRRLLENGANSSFINRLADDEAPISSIIRDPVERLAAASVRHHPLIPAPGDLFAPERRNSAGLLISEDGPRAALVAEIERAGKAPIDVVPLIGGAPAEGVAADDNRSPQDNTVVIGKVRTAAPDDIDRALGLAQAAQPGWDALGGARRAEILEAAAALYEDNRVALMAVMVREAGKTLENALGDVREAVDFLRYYAARARAEFAGAETLPGVTGERNRYRLAGRGVFACISPWNFPLAIFTGQIAAALAAGNAVAAKPAEQTPATAFLAVKLLHQAGIPGDVLALLPGDGGSVGAALMGDERVDGVAFTGSIETAKLIAAGLAARKGPIVPLIAETGGINAMIVDSSALPEQVVRDVIRSAFDSAGQRCSALRVLYLQEEVAPRILAMLEGAMRELVIGDPLDYATDIGPVIDKEAEETLEAHKRRMMTDRAPLVDLPLPEACEKGTFVAPAVYEIDGIGALEREVFGPVLHVVRYKSQALGAVCDAINAAGYGLTLGVHSRIEGRIAFITERVRIGNIYVNRNQIGAVVGSQPFGGEGLSGTGPKAGGPHTLARFATERVVSTDTTASGGNASLVSLAAEERED